jgi:hypothetical protein
MSAPQWATRSASRKPGRISFHSWKVRIGICCLSRVPARVVERPRWPRVRWEREPPIRCGCAHGEQLTPALLGEMEMLMPLQRFDERREKGDEPFGADAVGGVPHQEQRVLDVWPVMAWALRGRMLFLRMVEEPHGVLAIVSSCCRKGIKQLALPLDRRCLAILRDHLLK